MDFKQEKKDHFYNNVQKCIWGEDSKIQIGNCSLHLKVYLTIICSICVLSERERGILS